MSIFSPTPYRDTLSKAEQDVYRQITAGILEGEKEISIRCSAALQTNLSNILQCIHHDHPELFWVNWWSGIRFIHRPVLQRTTVQTMNLLEPGMIAACKNALNSKVTELSVSFPKFRSPDLQYRFILGECIKEIDYKDTGSALWDHTIIGPLLSHTAVCEGISKLFLLYCQHFNLPCITISGSYNNAPHAWNVIAINDKSYHIDVTAALQQGKILGQLLITYKTSNQLMRLGYKWNNCVLLNTSGR